MCSSDLIGLDLAVGDVAEPIALAPDHPPPGARQRGVKADDQHEEIIARGGAEARRSRV